MKKNPNDDEAGKRAADTSRSIHLSASAGSGKTRALKERYLALLDMLDSRGLNIDQAAAITFTDKAAAEIKERVLLDLPEAMLKKIIRGRQDLRISTIHSFCMNLLKRYPLEAGLPPDFGVLDFRDQASKVHRAVEEALEACDREPGLMDSLRGFSTDELVSRAAFLLSIRSRLKRIEIDEGGRAGLIASVQRGAAIDAIETEEQALIAGAAWHSKLVRMEQLLRSQADFYEKCLGQEHVRLAAAAGVDAAASFVEALASVYFNKDASASKRCAIPKSKYAGKDRDEYEKLFFDIQAMLGQFRSLHARLRSGRQALSLVRVFQHAEQRYQAAKLREGVLDFDDLEIYAYGLLQGLESPDILYWLDRKILHFLVDEFQDTSDIQWAILNKLTEEIFAGQGAEKRMAPTLFVVGDEKQSIYRFREANYRLIESVRQKMERNLPADSRAVLSLDKNFRSAPEIVEIANDLFRALWGDAYTPSEAVRSQHKGSVRLLEVPAAAEGSEAPATEAEVLAREVRSFVANGTVVYERTADAGAGKSGWTERAARYGDCAILIQSRTRLKEYEAALQRENIPYRVIGGIGFYEEDEVQALMNILFFLWNREDKLALAAALTSRLFGLSDRDIFDVVSGEGGMINRLRELHPEEWSILHGWMKLAGLVPLAHLVHRIIGDSGAYVRFGKGNPQAVFNIDKLLDTAREFDRRGYTTLQDFVEWVRNIRATEQREATADMNLPGFAGSVSIMTVHKAKGLEYPILFLPGMNQQPRSLSSGPLAVIEDQKGTVRLAFKDSGPLYQELWDREQEELLREHQRLLYVAMTRARDHLVMIGKLNDGGRAVKQNSWLSYLHQAAPRPLFGAGAQAGPVMTVYAYPAPCAARTVKVVPGGEGRTDDTEARPLDLPVLIANLSPIERSLSPEWKKATGFIRHDTEASPETLVPHAGPGGVSPLTRGTVLHRCLEEFTKTGEYDAARMMEEHEDILVLPPARRDMFIEDAQQVLQRVLNNREHAWIFEPAPRSYSELPFLHKKGNTLVSGVIDRVIIRENEGFVIDYKAILIGDDEAHAAWLAHYRPQVQVYCEAVKEIFALRAVTGYLLFLDSNMLSLCVPL